MHQRDKHKYHCEHCKKSFPHPSNLRTHVDIVHLGIKNHVCDTCGKAYVTERELIYHMDTTSKCNKTQQLRCDKCDMGKFAIHISFIKVLNQVPFYLINYPVS